ncbi:MAG: hypothetical protein CL610_24410 [Anaerolineaceae bacterium]|nr:hypothetical protein [Anaerolineaceae bacterium]
MDRIDDYVEVVRHAVADYANATTFQASTFFSQDDEHDIYSVIVVPDLPRPFPARVVVMARIVGENIVIDEDTTDRPLYEALLRRGIPREKIILAYAGEQPPASN